VKPHAQLAAFTLAPLLFLQCSSDSDAVSQPPEPTPANVCANLSRICPESLDSCEASMRFVWEVAPVFGVDVYCLQVTGSVTEARSCGYPCGGEVT
jgi:hypothetical protein